MDEEGGVCVYTLSSWKREPLWSIGCPPLGFFSALFFLLSLFFLLPFCVLRNLWLKKLTFLTTANNPDGGRIQEDTYLLFPCASFPFFCSLFPISLLCMPPNHVARCAKKKRKREKERKKKRKILPEAIARRRVFCTFLFFFLTQARPGQPQFENKRKR